MYKRLNGKEVQSILFQKNISFIIHNEGHFNKCLFWVNVYLIYVSVIKNV